MAIAKIILSLVLSVSAWAEEPYSPYKVQPLQEPPAFACAFQHPILFGASNSAGYNSVLDGLHGRGVRPLPGYQPSRYNPIAMMQQKYFGKVSEENISEINKFRNTNVSEVVASVAPHKGHGYSQLKALEDSVEGRAKLKSATALVSTDAFYWQAAEGQCDEALSDIDEIIRLARRYDKPLVLATVPDEAAGNVLGTGIRDGRVSGLILYAGKTPEVSCVAKINAKLKDPTNGCNRDRHCHLLDLHETIRQLNGNGVIFERKTNRTPQFRFDGVHLTEKGKRYIEYLIAQSMNKNPPPCARAPQPPGQHEVSDAYVVR